MWRRRSSAAVPPEPPAYPPDFDDATIALCERVAGFTMTGPERIAALRDAVRYLVAADVPGAIVECGVWRGGSMMAAALTLLEAGTDDRDLFLFDTFTPPVDRPIERDIDLYGARALDAWEAYEQGPEPAVDPFAGWPGVDDVQRAVASTGYPPERIHTVPGVVADTLPGQAPEAIALLRLDTDYYESTVHEMTHLYPRVSDRGVLVVDDYGHFRGARDAVDGFFAARGEHVLLHRVDYTARALVVRR